MWHYPSQWSSFLKQITVSKARIKTWLLTHKWLSSISRATCAWVRASRPSARKRTNKPETPNFGKLSSLNTTNFGPHRNNFKFRFNFRIESLVRLLSLGKFEQKQVINKLLKTFYIYTRYFCTYDVEIYDVSFCPIYLFKKNLIDSFATFVALNCVIFGKPNWNKGYDNSRVF